MAKEYNGLEYNQANSTMLIATHRTIGKIEVECFRNTMQAFINRIW